MRATPSVPLLITVDGPAASGKSTIARRLAARLGVPYLYTGAMYRAVTWLARQRGIALSNERALVRLARTMRIRFVMGRSTSMKIFVQGADVTKILQHPEISRLTSAKVATCPGVRTLLVGRQRRMLTRRGLVAEGRDCGSVVFPAAPYKFYLTASFATRLARRQRDLAKAGIHMRRARIREELARRDREDRMRPQGALAAQPDAWIIDNTHLAQEETLARMLRRIDRAGL